MLLAALSRWPGLFPPNFSAFYALAFCAGAFFPPTIKWWLPLATLVLLFTSLWLRWVPPIDYVSPFADPWGNLQQMLIPAAAIGLREMAIQMRMTRATVLEVLRQDFVRTARDKGLAERLVVYRHALRNALIPVTTVLGPALAGLITGSFFIETIFSFPGMGRLFVQAIGQRDYPVILGTTLLYAALIALANLVVDVAYGWLDPRISYA